MVIIIDVTVWLSRLIILPSLHRDESPASNLILSLLYLSRLPLLSDFAQYCQSDAVSQEVLNW